MKLFSKDQIPIYHNDDRNYDLKIYQKGQTYYIARVTDNFVCYFSNDLNDVRKAYNLYVNNINELKEVI